MSSSCNLPLLQHGLSCSSLTIVGAHVEFDHLVSTSLQTLGGLVVLLPCVLKPDDLTVSGNNVRERRCSGSDTKERSRTM